MLPEHDERRFDVAGKEPEWHTAFYYLAEHVRSLTNGQVNHKELYSLVGVDGRYVNHANPLVRKRTAGALSRIVHSRQYAQDMRSRYLQDGLAFDRAAYALCKAIAEEQNCADDLLANYLKGPCWSDVYRGLEHERASWRGDLDLFRAGWEMRALVSSGAEVAKDADWMTPAIAIMAGLLHIVAFGHLDFTYARSLIDQKPTGPLSASMLDMEPSTAACLIRFVDAERSAISGSWTLAAGRPFTIGRYTDCDIVEIGGQLSRIHCCLYHVNGRWYFEDMDSRNGSVVVHGDGSKAYDSEADGAHVPVALQRGDAIVLAGRSRYWFGAHQDVPRYAVVGF